MKAAKQEKQTHKYRTLLISDVHLATWGRKAVLVVLALKLQVSA